VAWEFLGGNSYIYDVTKVRDLAIIAAGATYPIGSVRLLWSDTVIEQKTVTKERRVPYQVSYQVQKERTVTKVKRVPAWEAFLGSRAVPPPVSPPPVSPYAPSETRKAPVPPYKIAFVSDRDGNQEIYVMNADGSDQTNITNNSASERDAEWSPDGSKIAFVSHCDGNQEIYVMNADGSDQTNITNNPANDYSPEWSPDGTHIVFVSDRDGNEEIYIMNADGTDQTNITNNPANDRFPVWSPQQTR